MASLASGIAWGQFRLTVGIEGRIAWIRLFRGWGGAAHFIQKKGKRNYANLKTRKLFPELNVRRNFFRAGKSISVFFSLSSTGELVCRRKVLNP
jgi:hypothetical protein